MAECTAGDPNRPDRSRTEVRQNTIFEHIVVLSQVNQYQNPNWTIGLFFS